MWTVGSYCDPLRLGVEPGAGNDGVWSGLARLRLGCRVQGHSDGGFGALFCVWLITILCNFC